MLSLASNTNCMLMDDELNILPISSHVRDGLKPIALNEDGTPDVPGSSETAAELKDLTESLRDVQARSVTCRIYLCMIPSVISETAIHWAHNCSALRVRVIGARFRSDDGEALASVSSTNRLANHSYSAAPAQLCCC